MTRSWNHTVGFSRGRAGHPLVRLIGVLAIAGCSAACSSGAASTGATTGTPTDLTATPAATSVADVHGAPGTVLADWLHQIVISDYKAACADMTPSAKAAATCAAPKAVTTLSALHGNFTVDGLKAATPISVTAAKVTGTKATVGGTDVSVSGTSLSSLMIKHGTGVTAKSFALSFELSEVHGGWYVTNLDMNI